MRVLTLALFVLGLIPCDALATAPAVALSGTPSAGSAADYAIVVSLATRGRPDWGRVVDRLRERRGAEVIVHAGDVADALPRLRALFPRHTCFVARPEEATRDFVAAVHRLTRKLDDDPYVDTRWAILTGFDADDALAIASEEKPLTVRRVASGTEVALELCEEGVWYCELTQHKSVRKAPGGSPVEERCDGDTTAALVAALNDYRADLFVTSGHATERDWQIGYRYRNGKLVSEKGGLWGVDTRGGRHRVLSPNPKVYLPVGNCLMGHVDGPDAMALAFLRSAGVRQMIGYTVPTWYGYAGWGCLDTFLEQPGRYTLTEAFLANLQALIHRLVTHFPDVAREEPPPGKVLRPESPPGDAARRAGLSRQDAAGLLHDRDVVAFYGDPAWEARMADGPRAWEQRLGIERLGNDRPGTQRLGNDGLGNDGPGNDGAVYTLEIIPKRGERTFEPINRNGSQRGGRPIVEFLPHRIEAVEILEGRDLSPTIADDFILVPNPGTCDPSRAYRVSFRARRIGH